MTPSPLDAMIDALISSFGLKALKRAVEEREKKNRADAVQAPPVRPPQATEAARRRVAKKLAGMGRR